MSFFEYMRVECNHTRSSATGSSSEMSEVHERKKERKKEKKKREKERKKERKKNNDLSDNRSRDRSARILEISFGLKINERHTTGITCSGVNSIEPTHLATWSTWPRQGCST